MNRMSTPSIVWALRSRQGQQRLPAGDDMGRDMVGEELPMGGRGQGGNAD